MPFFTIPLRSSFPRGLKAGLSAFLLVTIAMTPLSAGPVKPRGPDSSSTSASPAVAPEVPKDGASRTGEAVDVMRKTVAFHRDAKDLALKFKASVYNAALDKQDEYQGKLLLKGSSRFRLEIPGGIYVSDGESYWEYHAQTNQVVLKRAKDMEDKPLPGEVLLRFLDSEPLSLSEAVDGGKAYLEMRLDPSRAMKNLDSLAVLVDRREYSVHRISSRDLSGNLAEYTVTSIKRNGNLKDKEFTFAAPKGAEVVDMRE